RCCSFGVPVLDAWLILVDVLPRSSAISSVSPYTPLFRSAAARGAQRVRIPPDAAQALFAGRSGAVAACQMQITDAAGLRQGVVRRTADRSGAGSGAAQRAGLP